MITQKFEEMPQASRLEMMVDMLRYENNSQAVTIAQLEAKIASLRAELVRSREDLDRLQQVIDMQNARIFQEQNS